MGIRNGTLARFLIWRVKHVPQRTFIYFLSIIVGLFSGLVAVILKSTTHLIQNLVTHSSYHNIFYFAFPVIGILITVLIKRVFKRPVGEGIPSTLYSISKRNGFLRPYKMYASVLTSAITVGFGGSVGLEGPAVSTGSAIGANLGRIMRINYKNRILLISCATTGAIAAIFGAPVAAIIFTIEVFSLDLTMASLIPLLLASVSGSITSIVVGGHEGFLLHVVLEESFRLRDLPFYVFLGFVSALVSVYFTKAYFKIEEMLAFFKKPIYKTILGGLAVGLLIFLIPPLYGEGYETINNIINGDTSTILSKSFLSEYSSNLYILLALFVGLIVFKVFAASLTLGAGGVGGIFAPTLFMGSSLGFVLAKTLNLLNFNVSESNFALVGMAGLMAGVMHAPLTAIFMIAEITGGHQLIIPLMLTAAVSFMFSKALSPYTIYTHQLAQRGELITHNKDRAILTLMKLREVVENDFIPVRSDQNLGELVDVFKKSHRNLFPVLNEEKELVGVLTLDDFKQMLFDKSLYKKIKVADLMIAPPAIVDTEENMDEVMRKFQETGAWNLPVVSRTKYLGFISKSKMFSAYRKKLQDVSRDE